MANFNCDPETSALILAAIWQRKPLIFALKNQEKPDTVLDTLLNFVPEYRQKIFCGVISKKIFFVDKSAKILETQDLDSLIETIQTCYQEDGIYSPPIQFIFSAASTADFTRVLAPLNHGWIATTYLPVTEIMAIFEKFQPYHQTISENVDVVFVTGKASETALENKLVQRFGDKSNSVARFMIQMKMSEVKFICKAFLDEIEKGNRINQVLAEAQFGIDSLTFNRALMLLKHEYYAEVKPYVETVRDAASVLLGKLIKLNGLQAVLAVRGQTPVAFAKKQTTSEFSAEMLLPYVRLLENSQRQSIFGADALFMVKCNEIQNQYICVKDFILEGETLCLAFSLDVNVQIAMVISQIEKMISDH